VAVTDQASDTSEARLARRANIVQAARALVNASVGTEFDPVHSALCAVDVVMVAGAPWLRDGLERDFSKDEAGYRKIGGGANTPQMAYFFRSAANLIHYLKRQNFYTPRGSMPAPAAGMACFFDWDDRGRFNFTPDRVGIIIKVENVRAAEIVLATSVDLRNVQSGFVVKRVKVHAGDEFDRALIGYSDLP